MVERLVRLVPPQAGDNERREAEEVNPGQGISVGGDPREGGIEAPAPEIPSDPSTQNLIERKHIV